MKQMLFLRFDASENRNAQQRSKVPVRKKAQRGVFGNRRSLECDTGAERACWIFCLEKPVNATCASKYLAVPSFRAAYVLRARQSAPVRRRRTLLGLVNAKN